MTRKIINFLKSTPGRFLLVLLATFIGVVGLRRWRESIVPDKKDSVFAEPEESRRSFTSLSDADVDRSNWDADGNRIGRIGSNNGTGTNGNSDSDGDDLGNSIWNEAWDSATGSSNSSASDKANFKPLPGRAKQSISAEANNSNQKSPEELEAEAEKRRRELAEQIRKMELEAAMKNRHGKADGNGGRNGSSKDRSAMELWGKGNGYVSDITLYENTDEAKRIAAAKGGLSNTYAPYGRLIPCQLLKTVDSGNTLTPIIAIVLEDVWHNGKVVISAGTELHGSAVPSTLRNRINTQTRWTFVWRTDNEDNGKEMLVTALALDYTRSIKTGRVDITDGSAGLRGFTVETEEYKRLKLYAAQFVQGAGSGLTEILLREATTSGNSTYVDSTAPEPIDDDDDNEKKVAIAAGAQQVADQMVDDLVDQLTRDGSFVRVPSGTTFYLYVMQTMDKKAARPGATAGMANEKKEEVDPLVKQQQEATLMLHKVLADKLNKKSERSILKPRVERSK